MRGKDIFNRLTSVPINARPAPGEYAISGGSPSHGAIPVPIYEAVENQELLTDTGFELADSWDLDGLPNYFETNLGTPMTRITKLDRVHAGSNAILLTSPTLDELVNNIDIRTIYHWQANFPHPQPNEFLLEPGNTYQWSVYINVVSGYRESGALQLNILSAEPAASGLALTSGVAVGGSEWIQTDEDCKLDLPVLGSGQVNTWVKLTYDFDTLDSSFGTQALYFTFRLIGYAVAVLPPPQKFYLDDFSVLKIQS